MAALKAIQKANLIIPKNISVISISNGFIPTLYYPQISYVETSGYKLGKLAFSSMMACMAGSTFTQDLTIESILVEGGSSNINTPLKSGVYVVVLTRIELVSKV